MKYTELLASFRHARKNITKSKTELQMIQDQKLRAVLQHAYTHSPYYRQSFQAAGIYEGNLLTKPLTEFPTIDKAIVMEHFNDIVTTEELTIEELRSFDTLESEQTKLFKEKYHVVHSSGSTGKPMYFIYDQPAWNQMLVGIIRAALWGMSDFAVMKLLLNGPKIVYIAATDGRYGGAMAVGGGIDSLRGKQLFLDIKTPLAEWIQQIHQFQPNIVIGYPSAIKILADLVDSGRIQTSTTRVISCGEPLNENLRRYFESIFQSPVVNIYGASESLALGVETGSNEGMYLFDDLNYIEIIEGEMYLTSLYNLTQPLIRYKITDKLTLRPSDFGFSKAEILLSRNEDLLWFEDGFGNKEFMHPLAIEGFCVDGMLDYQFQQRSPVSFEILIESKEQANRQKIETELKAAMQEILNEKKLKYVTFELVFVTQILPNPLTGKKQLIKKAAYVDTMLYA